LRHVWAYRRPSFSPKRDGRRVLKRRRNLAGPRGRLPSLMALILARLVLFVVIALSLPLFAGCSSLGGGDASKQANDYVTEVNDDIDEHNRLFEEARATYTEAKEAVENADDPSGEAERFTQTRETMEEAQARLQEARGPLAEIRNLNTDTEIKEYAGILSEAVDTQIAAESREINFYQILEEDPTLEDNREEALGILEQVGDFYQRAEEDYQRAQELADANPELIRES
jgi:hypothetical protein